MGEPGAMPDHHVRDFEAALEAFQAGRWDDAQRLLSRLRDDGPTTVLRDFMTKRHQGQPPADWKGILAMESK